jgi:hypothetical protein
MTSPLPSFPVDPIAQRLRLLDAQLALLTQSITRLRTENEVLKAQLRQLGRKPASDFCVNVTRG